MAEHIHLALQPVRADRADEFERFLADVVQPAVLAQRPALADRWRVLRASGSSNGVVTYAFILDGGSITEDWELDVVLPAQYGKEEAQRLINDWLGTFAPLEPWAKAAMSAGQESNQLVWTLEPVTLT